MPDNIYDAKVGDKLTPEQIIQAEKGETQGTATEPEGVIANKNRKELEYPLNNPDDYKGRIVFNVMKDAETDLGNVVGAVTSFIKKTVNPDDDEPDGSAIEETTGANPEDKVNGVDDFKNGSSAVQTVTNAKPLEKLDRQVSLYLPVGLQYRDNVAYENMDLGGMGAGVESGLKSGSGAVNALIDGGFKTFQAALAGSANKDAAKVATVKLASALPDEISGAFRSAAGVTSNPNTRVLFKSVGLREFAFAFKFIATSPKEATEIKEIIKLFRTELYPENINMPVAGSNISIGYRFPNKFQIEVEYNGEQVATKIKPCYLRDVGVTYNNTAMAMHSDGNFSEIEMTLSFQETRTLNRKDVEEDGF